MQNKNIRRILVMILALAVFMQPFGAVRVSFGVQSATVNTTKLNVRDGAGTSSKKLDTLSKGETVSVLSEVTASDGSAWCKIQYSGKTGYVMKMYLKYSVTYQTDSAFERKLTAEGFPESYKQYLRELHAQYPNWEFTALQTGLDWNDVIKNESIVGRNLVESSSISSWKSTAAGAYNWSNSTWPGFDSDRWVAASEDIIKYYMDPRNFLDTTYVFQFLIQKYDANIDTEEGLRAMLVGTFMEGVSVDGGSADASEPGGSSSLQSGSSSSSSSSEYGPGVGLESSNSSSGSSLGSSSNTSSSSAGSSSSSSNGSEPQLVAPGESVEITVNTEQGKVTGASASKKYNNATLESPGSSSSSSSSPSDISSGSGVEIGPGVGLSSGSSSSSRGSLSDSTVALTGGNMDYAQIIMEAARLSGVNPYVLAAMIMQEQGSKGTSGLISGTHSSYSGIYNFFNVGAYQSGTTSAVQNGLKWAATSGSYRRPWNTIEKSIVGGAEYYSDNYVYSGQDTFYLKKFNVQGDNLYKHEYMTNVQGAASEGSKLCEAYTESMKNAALQFKIPVFENMPAEACSLPTGTGSPNNRLNALAVTGYNLTPTFDKDTLSYDLIVDTSVSAVEVAAIPADSKAGVTNVGLIGLVSDNSNIEVVVTAENGTKRTYTIHVVRQSGGQSSSVGSNAGSSTGTSEIGPGVTGNAQTISPGQSTSDENTNANTSSNSGTNTSSNTGATSSTSSSNASGSHVELKAPGQ